MIRALAEEQEKEDKIHVGFTDRRGGVNEAGKSTTTIGEGARANERKEEEDIKDAKEYG